MMDIPNSMDLIGLILAGVNVLFGLLFMAMGLPLARRKISMNVWYGVRIPKVMLSEALWYDINVFGGRQLIRLSVPSFVCAGAALLALVGGRRDYFLLLSALATAVLPVLCPLLAAKRTLDYAATQEPRETPPGWGFLSWRRYWRLQEDSDRAMAAIAPHPRDWVYFLLIFAILRRSIVPFVALFIYLAKTPHSHG